MILQKKPSKYKAVPMVYNGRKYHSKKEARYAQILDLRIKASEIISWQPQVKIDLSINGNHITNYVCDFRVVTKDGTIQYHEVKGVETQAFKIKWKILTVFKDQIIEPEAEIIIIK
jgi:hypothetical protein